MAEFYKDWGKSKSLNNDGTVPFYRPISLTPEEQAQARKNIGVTGSPDITNLEHKVDELEGNVATVEGNMDTVSGQFTALSASATSALDIANTALVTIGTYSADIYTVSAKADTLSAGLSGLSGRVGTNETNIASISGKNTVQDNRISALSSTVAGLTNSATYHEAKIQNLENEWSAYSAYEDGRITSAINDLPVQVSAEVSGQLSGKQNVLTAGQNVSIASDIIDVKNYNCSAIGNYSLALGELTVASGMYSLAHGASASAVGNWSFANGAFPLASGEGSHAEGVNAWSIGMGSHAEGISTESIGAYSHAEGASTKSIGTRSHAEGYRTIASGYASHAEGHTTRAIASESHAEGLGTSAIDTGTHAEGMNTIAAYTACHAEGRETYAYKEASHAEGFGSSAVGHASHAEGYYCLANHTQSHAEGDVTSAYGRVSHTEGSATCTIADGSHAEGAYTSAYGLCSHVEGDHTFTSADYQHVEGKYNAPVTGALHVIGNGTTTANRSNIVETYVDHVVVNGNLNVSGTDYIDMYDTVNRFMFDNAQRPTGSKVCILKLDTNDWVCTTSAYTNYNKRYNNIMSGENYNYDRNAGYSYPTTVVCGLRTKNNGYIGITDWKGDISKIGWNGTSGNNKNMISAWPNKMPADYGTISTYERMFSDNSFVTTPDSLPSDFLEKTSATNLNMQLCFAGCSQITGNWDAYVQAYSAKSPANYKSKIFQGCTGMDNYSTYTANSGTSSMFV